MLRMDIYRTYNTTTHSITKTANAYAGQIGDNLSTRLHFDYEGDVSLPSTNEAFIVFAVYDENHNPLVYGRSSTPAFDGLTFDIPWDVTSRITSRRLEYQLWFLEAGVTWDGENWGSLDKTKVTMSAVDGIAIKPSIAPKCGCNPPFLPTAAEPGVLGWISLWQKVGLIGPVGQEIDQETGCPVLIFRTYAGDDSRVLLQNIAGLVDGKVPIELLPTSVQTVTADVAQLKTEVETPSTGLLNRMTSAESNITSFDGRLDTVEPKVATLQNEVEDPSTGLIKQVQDLQRLGLRYEVYQSYQDLPVPGSRNVLYLVRHAGTQTDNYYDEYLWVTNGATGVYELIGTTQFTLNITGDAYNVRLNGAALPTASSSSAGVITASQYDEIMARVVTRYQTNTSLSRSGTNIIHNLGAVPVSVAVYVNNLLTRCRVDIVDTNTIRLKPTSDIAEARVIIGI